MKPVLAATYALTALASTASADLIRCSIHMDVYPADPAVEAIRLARVNQSYFEAKPFAGAPFAGIPVGPLAAPMDPSSERVAPSDPSDNALFDSSPLPFWADVVLASSTALAF